MVRGSEEGWNASKLLLKLVIIFFVGGTGRMLVFVNKGGDNTCVSVGEAGDLLVPLMSAVGAGS